MSSVERIEEVEQAVLRRTYRVRAAIMKPSRECLHSAMLTGVFENGVVPLFGPEHEDKDIIGFPYKHYHIDWRFASTRAYVKAYKSHWHFPETPGTEKIYVLTSSDILRIEEVELQLRRHATDYPVKENAWPERLELAYQHHSLKAGMVCPHRGARLSSCKQENGCVTCPLHGLRWEVTTGALSPIYLNPSQP